LLALAQSFLRGRDIEPQEASRLVGQVVEGAPNISAPVLQEIRSVRGEVSRSSAGQVSRDTAEQLRMALDRYAAAS